MRIVTLFTILIFFQLIQLGLPGCAKTGVFLGPDSEESGESTVVVTPGSNGGDDPHAEDVTGSDDRSRPGDTSEIDDFDDSDNIDPAVADTATPGKDSGSDAAAESVLETCRHTAATVARNQPRVMILQDRSSSMNRNDKWIMAKDAIAGVVNTYNNRILFGLDLFSSPLAQSDERCTVADSALLDAAPQNAESIVETLDMYEPARSTPLLRAMYNYSAELDASYAPEFQTGGNSTLIIVSDGQDTCGVDGVFGFETSATPTQLGEAADTLLKYYGIQTIAIGLGQQASPESLNAIAQSGGSVFSEYMQADSGKTLQEALETIAAELTASCDFSVSWSGATDPPPDQFELSINGTIIPETDNTCANGDGWFWADDSALTTITLCDESCSQVNENVEMETDFRALCASQPIPSLE